MTIKEFFGKIRQRLEKEYQILFDLTLEEVIDAVSRVETNSPNWQKQEIKPYMAKDLYGCFLWKLMDCAVSLADISNDPVYEKATHIAAVFRSLLAEETEIELKEVKIMSPSCSLEKIGLIKIFEGPNGERMLKPTELYRKIAEEIQKENDSY